MLSEKEHIQINYTLYKFIYMNFQGEKVIKTDQLWSRPEGAKRERSGYWWMMELLCQDHGGIYMTIHIY